ncbi:hypothetical protein MOK15_18385 [Sphingobium sp. BYY-5]|uniref:hypothetical protein n=1 Tax=Sphingobium sp. BYY-5 TaxID=2926400 RepID=UPI001FA77651|nr:hypothetical protein [Sphingobium sp. BYY-5]MCI4592059.1 hypothetical protein [Sphingobium sp. BYY-5]
MSIPSLLSRRAALLAGAFAVAGLSRPGLALGAARANPVPLPSADQIRQDYQQMVDFGPRLPGNANHVKFVDWMKREFVAAGLRLGPCESYAYRRWEPKRWSLDIIDGDQRHAVPTVAYFVRSQPTGPQGVTGPLVYAGRLNPDGPASLPDFPKGSILLFDAELPKMHLRQIVHPHFIHVRGETDADVLDSLYHRLWTMPSFQMDDLAARGVAGVAIIINASSAMIAGNFSPHASPYKPKVPALFIGQDAGDTLRAAAKAGRAAHLTLDAQWVEGDVPQLTAVLPGESEEVMIVDTHTDGQNFIEENGCIALLQLARHFASLPAGQRLRRSIVFAGWPGHMSGDMPEAPGWALAHPDLMKRAAAAFTIEHLGASEWADVPGKGYAATGHNEYMNWPATAGPLNDFVIDGIKRHDLLRHAVEQGPGYTTGRVFHNSGIPHVACIAGPNYLLGIVPNGHMDKLDADLASRQTAMIAEIIKQADRTPMADLKGSDSSLGADPIAGTDSSKRTQCQAS